MIVEGINFNTVECLKMSRRDFIDMHVDLFFLDRPKTKRRRILGDLYDLMEKENREG